MKVVSQLDPDGFLIGGAIADQSPLEPDVFLLPAFCVDLEPIEVPPGKVAKYNGSSFDLLDPVVPEELPVEVPEVDPKQVQIQTVLAAVTPRLLLSAILTGDHAALQQLQDQLNALEAHP